MDVWISILFDLDLVLQLYARRHGLNLGDTGGVGFDLLLRLSAHFLLQLFQTGDGFLQFSDIGMVVGVAGA